VLHIEDDPNDRDLLAAAVQETEVPFQLYSASDAQQAIAFLTAASQSANRRRFPIPALVLLDLKMPGSNGIEFLKWMRAQPWLSGIPVVVLSGSEMEEDIRQAYANGANAFLVKPLGFNALMEMVQGLNVGWFVAPRNGWLENNRQLHWW
jgi:CheY-like chemotaxis protein